MQDILEHAIRTVPHGSGPCFLPWHKVKFSARKNASEGYAYDCGLFHIVAIMDTTLLKSGKEGYALGCHALYGTGFQEPIPLHGLKQATVRADAPGPHLLPGGAVRQGEHGQDQRGRAGGQVVDLLAPAAGLVLAQIHPALPAQLIAGQFPRALGHGRNRAGKAALPRPLPGGGFCLFGGRAGQGDGGDRRGSQSCG